MNEDQIHRIGFILDETDTLWEIEIHSQCRADQFRWWRAGKKTSYAEHYDLIHMYMNFPFL